MRFRPFQAFVYVTQPFPANSIQFIYPANGCEWHHGNWSHLGRRHWTSRWHWPTFSDLYAARCSPIYRIKFIVYHLLYGRVTFDFLEFVFLELRLISPKFLKLSQADGCGADCIHIHYLYIYIFIYTITYVFRFGALWLDLVFEPGPLTVSRLC